MNRAFFVVVVSSAITCAPASAGVQTDTEVALLQDHRTLSYGSSTWSISEESGSASNFVGPVYDSTNFATSGAAGFGVGATSSTNLATIYGDQLLMVNGAGSTLDSFKFSIFCSSSSAADLSSATATIRFFRASTGTQIGGFTVEVGSLARGFFSVLTVNSLSSLGINFDVDDIIITQQLSNVLGATRMGTVFSTVSNSPALGTTNIGLYVANATTTAGFYTFTGAASASSGVYQASVIPAPGALALLGVAGLVGARRRR